MLAHYDHCISRNADLLDRYPPELIKRCIEKEIVLSKGEKQTSIGEKSFYSVAFFQGTVESMWIPYGWIASLLRFDAGALQQENRSSRISKC